MRSLIGFVLAAVALCVRVDASNAQCANGSCRAVPSTQSASPLQMRLQSPAPLQYQPMPQAPQYQPSYPAVQSAQLAQYQAQLQYLTQLAQYQSQYQPVQYPQFQAAPQYQAVPAITYVVQPPTVIVSGRRR